MGATQWAAGWADREPQVTHPPILSVRQFNQILMRERSRCDRTGQSFALVLFRSANGARGASPDLALRIAERLRVSDTVGWYRRGIAAVLLPTTDRAGAQMYVDSITLQLPEIETLVSPEIRTYPHAWEHHPDGSRASFSHADRELLTALAPAIPLWKRALDVIGAIVGLLVFSPLFLIYPLYLQLVSPGPVFYRQERVGFRGRRFTFLKFRSMHVDNSAASHRGYLRTLIQSDKPMEKLDDTRDPRIIPGGRFMRNSSLDEVPQFINVLRGEMSLVGPRPCIPYEAEEYLRWHAHRFDVLPGMSGLWQVSGKNRLSFAEMIRLDIAYTRRMSPLMDLWILAVTFPSIAVEAVLKIARRVQLLKCEPTSQKGPEEL